jgi:hypothetical protein
MTVFTVRKLNARGELVLEYEGELELRLSDGVLIDARWTRPALALGYTTFETGDIFREWYFTNRWYSIFEISSVAGALKGWYCNIAEPAEITGSVIAYRDLLLDLWVAPDGSALVLDEDEFAAESGLSPETRTAAEDALAELQRRVAERAPPFHTIPR